MKNLLLPVIISAASFSIMFFVLTGKVLESMIASGMLCIGFLVLLMILEIINNRL